MSPFKPAFTKRPMPFSTRNQSFTYNTVINIGGGGHSCGSFGIFGGGHCGGHMHHCGGGMSKSMQWAWGLGMLTSVLGALFNKGGTTQPPAMMPTQYPYSGYNIGYNAGLYTPGSGQYTQSGYNAGYNQGLYSSRLYQSQLGTGAMIGQYGTMQGQYGAQQTVLAAKGNELVAMVKDLGNDYGFQFGENEEVPQLTPDGQNYTYKGKVFSTVTDLRNYIEQEEGLLSRRRPDSAQSRPDSTQLSSDSTRQQTTGTHEEDDDVVVVVDETRDETTTGRTHENTDETTDETTGAAGHEGTAAAARRDEETAKTAVEDRPASAKDDNTDIISSQYLRDTVTEAEDDPTVMTEKKSKLMFAKLRGKFGNIPENVSLNPDGTYNYTQKIKNRKVMYENINLNALDYLLKAEKSHKDLDELEGPESYDNKYNNSEGRTYVDGHLSLVKQQISNTETLAAFLLSNSVFSSIELGKISKADFEETFANMFEDNVKNSKTSITEEEFLKYHQDYERNARLGDIRRDEEREKTGTVNMKEGDIKQLKNLFYAMSNGTGKVTKEQYSTFMSELFKENNGKVTKEEMGKFAAKWITQHNKNEGNIELKYDYGNWRMNRYMDEIRNAIRVYKANGETSLEARAKRDKIINNIYKYAVAEDQKLLEKYFKEEFGDDIKKYKNNWLTDLIYN